MRQRNGSRGGFTLVELLVVIGIIALLVSILMPALARARDQANRIKCMNNVRSIMAGIIMYTSENKLALPPTNWGGNLHKPNKSVDPKGTAGWLYDNPDWDAWTPNAKDPDWKYLEGGQVYRFLKNREVFKCPLHTDYGSNGATERFTSYLMNGSLCDMGKTVLTTYRISKFDVMDIIIWETGESNLLDKLRLGPPFNDGCSYPREWLSERHGAKGRIVSNGKVIGNGGASVGCIDGHVEWFSYKDYEAELRKPGGFRGGSRLNIAPSQPNGGLGL